MQTKNIIDPIWQQRVTDDILLYELLVKLEGEERVQRIADLVVIFTQNGQTEQSLFLLGLIWPAILCSCVTTGLQLEKITPTGKTFRLKLEGLSETEHEILDRVLQIYVSHLQRIILRLVGDKGLSTEVLELAGVELLSAAHLMTDLTLANKCFVHFVDFFAGYHHSNVEKGGILEKSPEILRRSLKDIPARGDHQPAKNLLVYLQGVESRLKIRDEAKQCETLWKMVKIIAVALCHQIHSKDILQLFLDYAGKIEEQDKKLWQAIADLSDGKKV